MQPRIKSIEIKDRFFGIDLIKIFAVFSVIGVHFLLNTNASGYLLSNHLVFVQAIWRQVFIICVPLFIMATGFLMINKVTPDKKYYQKILGVFGIYTIYSFITLLVKIYYFKMELTVPQIISQFTDFKLIEYSWYVNMYIGLFLMIPFINKLIKSMTKEEFTKLLIVLTVLVAIPEFWNNLPFEDKLIKFPYFWIPIYPIYLYLIGSYIRHYDIRVAKKYSIIGWFFFLMVAVGINVYYSNGKLYNAIGYYPSFLLVGQSIAFFLFFKDIPSKPNSKMTKIVSFFGSLTLDIYLLSYIGDKIFYPLFFDKYGRTPENINYGLIIVSVNFLACLLIASIRKIVTNIVLKIKNRKKKEDIHV